MSVKRITPEAKARDLAKYLRSEYPDYNYLRSVFRCLRKELAVEVIRAPKKLPDVPTEDESNGSGNGRGGVGSVIGVP